MTTMTTDTRAALQRYMVMQSASQAAVAKALNYSAAALSQYLRGQYQGDVAEVETRITAFLAREVSRAETPSAAPAGWVATSTGMEIVGLLLRAHRLHEYALVLGEAGVGKTCTLENYAQTSRGVVFVRCGLSSDRPIYLVRAVAEKLNIRVPTDVYAATRAVMAALRGTDRLLILDEAQRIRGRSLEWVRDIYDECQCGLVLSGNDVVQQMVYGDGQAAFAQHSSRVANQVQINNANLTLDDVELLAGHALDKTDTASRAALLEIARGRGGVRTMLKSLQLARELVAQPSEPMASLIQRAHSHRGFAQ